MSFAGELNDLGLSDIFQILALSKRTGTLTVTTADAVGQALFSSGLIVAGGLSPYPVTVADHLTQGALLRPENVAALVATERQDVRGPALVQRVGQDTCKIMGALEGLLRQMMATLLGVTEGSFHFVNADAVDAYEQFSIEGTWAICPKGLQAQYLAMDALRLRDEAGAEGGQQAKMRAPTQGGLDDWADLAVDKVLPPAAPEAAGKQDLSCLRDVVIELRRLPRGRTPAPLLLRALKLHCERGAYFTLEGGHLVGQSGFGQAASGRLVASSVGGTRVGIRQGSALDALLQDGETALGPVPDDEGHKALIKALGGDAAASVLMAPWRMGGRVVGLLVGDNPSGQPLTDAPGIDIVLAQGAAAPGPRG